MFKQAKCNKTKTFPSESIPGHQNGQIQKPMQPNRSRGLYFSNEPWIEKIGLEMNLWERFENRAFRGPLMHYK